MMSPLIALSAGALASSIAHAEVSAAAATKTPQRFDLNWQVPLGCPSHAEVAREIDGLIADSVGTPRSGPVYANATIAQESDGYALTLTLRDIDAQRSRHIGAPTCEELGHAAALIVAIAVDPTLLERRVDPPETGPAANSCSNAPKLYYCRLKDLLPASVDTVSGSKRDLITPVQGTHLPPMQPAVSLRAGIGTFASMGILPGLHPGLSLLGALQTPILRIELSASMLNARVEDEAAGRGANFSLYRASPRGCLLRSTSLWAIGPCLGIDLGAIFATGYGVDLPQSSTAFWGASTLGTLVEFRVNSGTLLAATGDLGIPWRRDDFRLLDRPLHKPAQFFGILGINLAAEWY